MKHYCLKFVISAWISKQAQKSNELGKISTLLLVMAFNAANKLLCHHHFRHWQICNIVVFIALPLSHYGIRTQEGRPWINYSGHWNVYSSHELPWFGKRTVTYNKTVDRCQFSFSVLQKINLTVRNILPNQRLTKILQTFHTLSMPNEKVLNTKWTFIKGTTGSWIDVG